MKSMIEPRRLLTVLVFCALSGVSTRGMAATCESGFREIRDSDGGHIYTTIVPYPSVDSRKVLGQFSRLATQLGYVVIAPADYSSNVAVLGIAKSPAPGPIVVTADPTESLVTVTSLVPPGARADAVHERTVVCDLLAAFDAANQGRPVGAARAASTDDDLTDSSRTQLPTAIPRVNLLSPKSRFDAVAARNALKPGNAVIRGQACGMLSGAIAYASHVSLFPATPYLEELLRLEKTAKPGRDQVAPEPEALKVMMTAKADARGRFQFSKMKPGRYYLMTTVGGTFGASRDVQIGRVEDNFGGANVYAKQDYTFDANSTIGKFVTVNDDGAVVDVRLQPPISANPFRRGMRGSILGCTQLP